MVASPRDTRWEALRTPILIGVLVVVLVPLGLLSVALARPLIDRAAQLVSYFVRPLQKEPEYLESGLGAEVLKRLSNGLEPNVAERLFVHRVPTWFPLPMDDPASRMETLRDIADTAPAQSVDWDPMERGEIRDAYALFLGGLANGYSERSRLLKDTQSHLAEVRGRRRASIAHIEAQRNVAVSRVPVSAGSLPHWLDVVLAWFIRPVNQQNLSEAIDEVWLSMPPNPADGYSQFPHISEPDEQNLARWFNAQRQSAPEKLAQVEVSAESAPPLSASSQTTAEPNAGTPIPELAPASKMSAVLYARDWEIFRFKRPWLHEELLEHYRHDWNLLFDIGWLFGGNGPLSQIPYAVVVAKDVLYRLSFASAGDYQKVEALLKAGSPLRISVGNTSLVVEPGAANLDPTTQTLSIAPMSTRAQVLAIVTLRY